jgi:hypothetical protein
MKESSSPTDHTNGHFSPLELLDQAEDDEFLLKALEGLTLDDLDSGTDRGSSN